MARYVIGVSGASGVKLALHLIHSLVTLDHTVELVLTQAAVYTASLELGKECKSPKLFLSKLSEEIQKKVVLHSIHDMGCSIASGSYPIDGMVIIPCSMATVAAISIGLGDNVLRRAADVTLKEKRRLILVPRETPLSTLHLENLLKLSRLGAVILPPIPAWYTEPATVEDIEFFIIGKVLDVLGIQNSLYKRWKV